MDQGRNFSAPRKGACVIISFLTVAAFASVPSEAFAQGGQTEVSKTTPSNPPPAAPPASAPAPAAAAPATAAATPATPAPKPVSPIGGSNPAWQTNVAQPPAVAQAPATSQGDLELVGRVNDYFNKMTDLQGTFVQTDPDNKQKRGKFYFERPGKVRFDYGSPSRLKIISDGEYLAIEDHDLNTSDRYPLDMTPFRLLLSPTVSLENDARILNVERGADAVILTVEDKKGDGSGRIRLFFSNPDMVLKGWIITDAQGLDTRIDVSNLEPNKQVSASLFEFSKDIGFKTNN